MILPKTVRVRDRVYRVVIKKRVAIEGGECWGATHFSPPRIEIAMGQDYRAMVSTFLHEVLHAIEFEYQLETVPHKAIYDVEGPLADLFAQNRSLRACVKGWTRKSFGRPQSSSSRRAPAKKASRSGT